MGSVILFGLALATLSQPLAAGGFALLGFALFLGSEG